MAGLAVPSISLIVVAPALQIIKSAAAMHSAMLCKTSGRVYVKKAAVCTVIGFPNGNTTTAVKIFETKDALSNRAGATFEDIELFSKHIGNGVKMNAAGGITSLKLGG